LHFLGISVNKIRGLYLSSYNFHNTDKTLFGDLQKNGTSGLQYFISVPCNNHLVKGKKEKFAQFLFSPRIALKKNLYNYIKINNLFKFKILHLFPLIIPFFGTDCA